MDRLPIISDKSGEIKLGSTFDFRKFQTGSPMVLHQETQEHEDTCDQFEYSFTPIKSTQDARQHLGIPAGLCLKIKSGEAKCIGKGDYLERSEGKNEVLLIIRRLKSSRYLKLETLESSAGKDKWGSHFVERVYWGRELLVKLDCDRLPGSMDVSRPGLDGLLWNVQELASTLEDTTGTKIQSFFSGNLPDTPKTIDDLNNLMVVLEGLDRIEGPLNPIECELKPLTSLRLPFPDIPHFNEDAQLGYFLAGLDNKLTDIRNALRYMNNHNESISHLTEQSEEKLDMARMLIEGIESSIISAIVTISDMDKLKKAAEKYDKYIAKAAKAPTAMASCVNIIMAESRELEEMIGRYTLGVNRNYPSPPEIKELRVVLVGKTGVGKSATGNTLIGRPGAFLEQRSLHSVTETCKEEKIRIGQVLLRVIDTPGIFDTKRNMSDVQNELAKVLITFPEGVHAFVFVMNAVNRYTQEEKDAVKEITNHFGDSVLENCILLLTHADTEFKEESLDNFLSRLIKEKKDNIHDPGNFLGLINRLSYRVMAFSNVKSAYPEMRTRQRDANLSMIYRLLTDNKCTVYSNRHFLDAKHLKADREVHEKEREDKQKQKQMKKYDKHISRVKDVTREIIAEMVERKGTYTETIDKDIDEKVREHLRKKAPETLLYLAGFAGDNQNKDRIGGIVQQEVNLAKLEYYKGKEVGEAHKEMRLIVEKYVAEYWVEVAHGSLDRQKAMKEIKKKIADKKIKHCGEDDISIALDAAIKSENLAALNKFKINGMVANLHKYLKSEIEIYVKNVTGAVLQSDKGQNFKIAVDTIIPRVNNKLNTEERKYFTDDDIEKEGRKYIENHEEELKKLTQCFPGDSMVMTTNGTVPMKRLKIGDKVLTSDKRNKLCFEPVIMFTRAIVDEKALYILIKTTNGISLALSHEHLIPIGQPSRLQPARSVVPGDKVFVAFDGGDSLQPAEVGSVAEEWRDGIYCPHTTGGSIVVNGVLASCFTTRFSPLLSHMLMVPVRLLFQFLPSSWFNAIPYNNALGMPSLLAKVRQYFM